MYSILEKFIVSKGEIIRNSENIKRGRQYDAETTLSTGTKDRSAAAKNEMIIGKLK